MKINKGFTQSLENGIASQKRSQATMPFFSAGFTLIELLVVIGIMTIILSMSFYFFSDFGKRDALEKDVAGLTAFIRNARLLSIASKDAMPFGIHLESGRAVLFEGSTYTAGGANEKLIDFSGKVYMSSHSLTLGSPDIVFARLTGGTSNYGGITLSLKDGSASTTITILRTGVIQ